MHQNRRREVARERHVVAHENAIADGHREPHGFVVGISYAERTQWIAGRDANQHRAQRESDRGTERGLAYTTRCTI